MMRPITSRVSKKVLLYSKKALGLLTLTLLLFSSSLILNHTAEAQQLVCPSQFIEQITDETSGDSRETSINADGTRIAFRSNADINGGNPEGNQEIYLFDTTTGIFTQITDEASGNSRFPSINADGTRIAFESNADINGGNPEGNIEIYLFDTTTGIFTQITDEMAGVSRFPSINADGARIAFQSTANLNSGNPEGNQEIYLFNTTTGIISQITDEMAGASREPSINADGTRIAFPSTANLNSGNPEGNGEIYLFDTTTGIFTQITDETAGDSRGLSINGDGNRIAFRSDADINEGNPEGNIEIYLFDTTTGITTQITDETLGDSTGPSINGDGTRIAFRSTADINGGNPEGNGEIYLAACIEPANVPTLSQWGLIAMAGLLGIVGFIVMRRRKVTA
ncbi:MAG: hypothetical protein DHS20C13_10260 [Thermodesulfobacteriota bacterium]|nr:MAG: hypothetical protein DHS20C13_10260 [Thermodesulfobacteriota bacterium]